jgi:hypothetical protein
MSARSTLRGILLFSAGAAAVLAAPAGFPSAGESLNYTVNWPTGLSLGEAHLRADRTADGWRFEFGIDAAVPGFAISDHYNSGATSDFCSVEFQKEVQHGKKKTSEKTSVDSKHGIAERSTSGGGSSEISVPACVKDALTFLYFARRELAQGRVPPQQLILFGAPYQVRLEYTGSQTVSANEQRVETDRVVVTFKGPASDVSFEIFFARDPARTPVVVRAPFPLGTFSMELVR